MNCKCFDIRFLGTDTAPTLNLGVNLPVQHTGGETEDRRERTEASQTQAREEDTIPGDRHGPGIECDMTRL